MVVQELAVGMTAKRCIARRAQDEAMPRLIHGVRGHPDDLPVAEGGSTASQPLP
jgi:hypothetical protein